jgi:hypothetical protein
VRKIRGNEEYKCVHLYYFVMMIMVVLQFWKEVWRFKSTRVLWCKRAVFSGFDGVLWGQHCHRATPECTGYAESSGSSLLKGWTSTPYWPFSFLMDQQWVLPTRKLRGLECNPTYQGLDDPWPWEKSLVSLASVSSLTKRRSWKSSAVLIISCSLSQKV